MTFEVLFDAIAGNIFEIFSTIFTMIFTYYVLPLIKNDIAPWLREKRIYEIIKKLVQAAEKMAESGAIEKVDKKATVIKLLKDRGIEVTTEIEALIESCVKDLDIATNTLMNELKK